MRHLKLEKNKIFWPHQINFKFYIEYDKKKILNFQNLRNLTKNKIEFQNIAIKKTKYFFNNIKKYIFNMQNQKIFNTFIFSTIFSASFMDNFKIKYNLISLWFLKKQTPIFLNLKKKKNIYKKIQ